LTANRPSKPSMQLEEPLAKDLQLWRGELSFCPGNVGRLSGEMRNGEEKAPPG
jgi:hypothetical protein